MHQAGGGGQRLLLLVVRAGSAVLRPLTPLGILFSKLSIAVVQPVAQQASHPGPCWYRSASARARMAPMARRALVSTRSARGKKPVGCRGRVSSRPRDPAPPDH